MIRFMLDTDIAADLTGHAEILAFYSDLVTDPATFEAHYPHSTVLWIDRGLGDPNDKATIMDIETGALTIGDAPSLYDRWHAQGRKDITVYVNRDNMGAVSQAMGDRAHFQWIATLDGTLHIPSFNPLHTPAAIQFATAAMLGLHADGSLVLEDNWHGTPTNIVPAVIRRDINHVLSTLAGAQSELHRMATLIGG